MDTKLHQKIGLDKFLINKQILSESWKSRPKITEEVRNYG